MNKHDRGIAYALRCRLASVEGEPLSQQRFSQLLSVSISTVARWERGSTIERQFARKLERLSNVLNEMDDMIHTRDRLAFLEQRHPRLLHLRPIDLLNCDEGEAAVITLLLEERAEARRQVS